MCLLCPTRAYHLLSGVPAKPSLFVVRNTSAFSFMVLQGEMDSFPKYVPMPFEVPAAYNLRILLLSDDN